MINVADNGIGNKGLEYLTVAPFKSLIYLNLENNEISGKALPYLKKLISKDSPLQDLWLGNNQIDDSCLVDLSYSLFKSWCKLIWLDISNNPLSEVGLNSLFNAIVGNQSLE